MRPPRADTADTGTTAMYRNSSPPPAASRGKFSTPFSLALTSAILATSGVANAQTWRITPRVGVTQTYSDNAQQATDLTARADWITEATPGIRVERTGARVNAFLDFQLRNFIYINESRLNNSQKTLASSLKVEAIEKLFFIDSQASITQQNRSPFASSVQTDLTGGAGAGNNRVETTTYQIAPYVKGHIADLALFQVRYSATETRTNEEAFAPTRVSDWSGKFTNASASAKLGWSLDASALSVRNRSIGTREVDRLRAGLNYALLPQLRFSVAGGRESTDYASENKRGTTTYGLGLEWSPSPRTQVAGVREHRFFGDGYNVLVTHRTPMTAWRFNSSKDVSVLPSQLSTNDPGSVFNSLSDLLQSTIRDPAERARAVQSRLAQTGIPAGFSASSNFLTTRPFVSRTSDASVSLLGALNTITFTYNRNEQRSVGLGRADSAGAPAEDVRRENISAAWAHRLTALSTMTLYVSRLRSEGLTLDRTRSTQNVQTLSWSRPLNPRAAMTVGVQRVNFDTTANNDYKENFVFATLSYRF
jgi:uncharacterized protein (PEP-CTERM system associated)